MNDRTAPMLLARPRAAVRAIAALVLLLAGAPSWALEAPGASIDGLGDPQQLPLPARIWTPDDVASADDARDHLILIDSSLTHASARNAAVRRIQRSLDQLPDGARIALMLDDGHRVELLLPWTARRLRMAAALDALTGLPGVDADDAAFSPVDDLLPRAQDSARGLPATGLSRGFADVGFRGDRRRARLPSAGGDDRERALADGRQLASGVLASLGLMAGASSARQRVLHWWIERWPLGDEGAALAQVARWAQRLGVAVVVHTTIADDDASTPLAAFAASTHGARVDAVRDPVFGAPAFRRSTADLPWQYDEAALQSAPIALPDPGLTSAAGLWLLIVDRTDARSAPAWRALDGSDHDGGASCALPALRADRWLLRCADDATALTPRCAVVAADAADHPALRGAGDIHDAAADRTDRWLVIRPDARTVEAFCPRLSGLPAFEDSLP